MCGDFVIMNKSGKNGFALGRIRSTNNKKCAHWLSLQPDGKGKAQELVKLQKRGMKITLFQKNYQQTISILSTIRFPCQGEDTTSSSTQPWIPFSFFHRQTGMIRLMEGHGRDGALDSAHIPGGTTKRDRWSGQKTKNKKVPAVGADGKTSSQERVRICGSQGEIASDHIGLSGLVGKARMGDLAFGTIQDTVIERTTHTNLSLGPSAPAGRSTTLEPANTKDRNQGLGAM